LIRSNAAAVPCTSNDRVISTIGWVMYATPGTSGGAGGEGGGGGTGGTDGLIGGGDPGAGEDGCGAAPGVVGTAGDS